MVDNQYELAWAAGIFEGEGYFTTNPTRLRPYAGVSMTDEDVVRRFFAAIGVGNVTGPYQHRSKDGSARKPYWRWQVSGAAVIEVVDLLWPGLGERRRSRALEVLQAWVDWSEAA